MFGLPDGVTACLFDMDGVVTQTAVVHAAAWKEMFDEFLRARAESTGTEFVPFDAHHEYDAYVDGKPRLDGTRSFLESRGIELPEGTPDDPPGTPTIYGLSNRKNDLVLAKLAQGGVQVYEGTVTYIRSVRDKGISTAIVSSSANTKQILDSAGLAGLFDVRVDGLIAKERGLRGKPAPDTFLAAAEELHLTAAQAAVFEDALAGRRGGPGRALRARGGRGPGRPGRRARQARRRHRGEGPRGTPRQGRQMIKQSAYGTEPWRLVEKELDLDLLAQSESIFALSNGHIGLRGNLDEGDPHGLPGSYLNSVYEVRPLPYAEAGYGFPDDGQTVINVTNGKIIRLLVDDEPFDIRYGTLHSHERVLDLRAGTLTREVDWSSPAGARIKVTSVRMVSLTQRAIAAISYTVEPVDAKLRLVLQSEIVTNEELPRRGKDPRLSAVLENPLISEESQCSNDGGPSRALLVHRTRASGLRIAAGMSHVVTGPAKMANRVESYPDLARFTVATEVAPGEQVQIVKFIGYGWSSERSRPALIDQVVGALAAAHLTGWDGLLAEQRAYLDEFWDGADVELDGDAEIQQAVRFGLFHILQAGARAEYRPIAAKGLTGTGYDGHTFWDTESFVLPVLMYTHPAAAADALRWRHLVLDEARRHATDLGLAGAAFPWRTIRGQECSGYWPAGTAAFHINADIADAALRYLDATEDTEFEQEIGLELLVETARLWRSLGQHDATGRFRIDGVTGPDEYSAVKDNNIYTNLMAQRNLACAADLVVKLPDAADKLGVTTEEAASWRDAAAAMYIPFDERLNVHPQHEGFTNYARWDFMNTAEDHYPLLLHYPYFQLYRKQVVKQADLVLAMYMRPDAFTPEEKARNFAYYEPLTVRDSSLSACTQAVIAAEVGQLELAHDYLAEAALMDLRDVEHNTSDGVHMASLAGAWIALVAGFGGMRAGAGSLVFSPRLPGGIAELRFRLRYRGRRLRVTITSRHAKYELLDGEPLPVVHHGKEFELGKKTTEREIPQVTAGPRPEQPPGRAPYSRGGN